MPIRLKIKLTRKAPLTWIPSLKLGVLGFFFDQNGRPLFSHVSSPSHSIIT